LERDPEKVRWDVMEGFVSLKAAREEYGVALDPVTLDIDWEETARLRDELRNVVSQK
jgi:N-methylhydantoinase B